MSSNDVDIHITGTGGKQAANEFGLVTDGAKQADNALARFGKKGMDNIDSFNERLKGARDELDSLYTGIDKISNAGMKMAAVGGASLLVANSWSKAGLEADNLDARLESILQQQGRLGDRKAIVDVSTQVRDEGHFSDDGMVLEAAVHLASFSVNTQDLNQIQGLVARQARTMAKGGIDLDLTGVADSFGKGYNDISLAAMKRTGLAFADQDIAAVEAAKSISAAAGRMEWMRRVTAAVEGNTVELSSSLGEEQARLNDVTFALGEMQEELGRGVNDAKGGALQLLGGILDKMNEIDAAHPGFIRAIGKVTALGGSGLLIGGGLLVGGGMLAKGALDIVTFTKALRGGQLAAEAAAGAKKGLLKSTLDDLDAEKAKTTVANEEAKALLGSGKAAETAAEKTGLLARAKNLMGSAKTAMSTELTTIGSRSITGGGLAMGAGAGIAGGMAISDLSGLFTSNKEEQHLLGSAGGLAVGALTVFAPEVGLPIAAGLVIADAIKRGWEGAQNATKSDERSDAIANTGEDINFAEFPLRLGSLVTDTFKGAIERTNQDVGGGSVNPMANALNMLRHVPAAAARAMDQQNAGDLAEYRMQQMKQQGRQPGGSDQVRTEASDDVTVNVRVTRRQDRVNRDAQEYSGRRRT